MKKVLCVCHGNTCRSPMMAALLQQELGNEFQVESAGVVAQNDIPASDFSVSLMKERGIDISGHRSRWVGNLNLSEFPYIICADKTVADKVAFTAQRGRRGVKILMANGDNGGIPDPFAGGWPAYRECLALLDKIVPAIAKDIRG